MAHFKITLHGVEIGLSNLPGSANTQVEIPGLRTFMFNPDAALPGGVDASPHAGPWHTLDPHFAAQLRARLLQHSYDRQRAYERAAAGAPC